MGLYCTSKYEIKRHRGKGFRGRSISRPPQSYPSADGTGNGLFTCQRTDTNRDAVFFFRPLFVVRGAIVHALFCVSQRTY